MRLLGFTIELYIFFTAKSVRLSAQIFSTWQSRAKYVDRLNTVKAFGRSKVLKKKLPYLFKVTGKLSAISLRKLQWLIQESLQNESND